MTRSTRFACFLHRSNLKRFRKIWSNFCCAQILRTFTKFAMFLAGFDEMCSQFHELLRNFKSSGPKDLRHGPPADLLPGVGLSDLVQACAAPRCAPALLGCAAAWCGRARCTPKARRPPLLPKCICGNKIMLHCSVVKQHF